MIPDDADKPADPRRERKLRRDSLAADLARIMASSTAFMPEHDPDAALAAVTEERVRLQYEGELAYLRGDFRRTMRCFMRTEGDDAARLRACPVAIVAAISLGDYRTYAQIETYLKGCVRADRGSNVTAMAELALATVAVSVIAPNMAPGWLKEGDLGALPVQARPNALYLRAKYFLCLSEYETALAVAQTTLTMVSSVPGITMTHIYLRVVCAVACYSLGRGDEAKRWLLEAMRISLPHGFVTPFAEIVTALGGQVEMCLEQAFPDWRAAAIEQWKGTWRNWITFHNQFAKDNITLILSLREYHLALLVARRVPYAEIAKQHYISVGRLKNIMQDVYGKLSISSRHELARYVL